MILDNINCNYLKTNTSFILFIRHAQKDINNQGLLSKEGVKQANSFGIELKKINLPIKIISSPELRCVQTAKIINNVISSMNNDIILSNKLGEPGLQIKDNKKYNELYAIKKCREIYSEWKDGQHYDALRTPDKLKQLALDFLNNTYLNNGITVYISQSGTVAGIGHALKLIDYNVSEGDWVDYLDGFLLEVNKSE